jgi:transcription elongation GreA/GreB family factor
MREELEKLVAAGKIGRQHVDPLLQLIQCGYCSHRSWGFGKITTVDTVFGRRLIDFQSRPGHSMDLAFGVETLKPIPSEHILARKASDLAGLRQMAALQHLDLIRLVLKSFGGSATADQIQGVLVPDVIADDWRKWWEGVKRELKRNGHFIVPLKKSDPIVYLEAEISIQDRLMQEFRAARGLKARLLVMNEILKVLDQLTDLPTVSAEIEGMLNAEIVSHQQTMPALALEAVFTRDEFRLLGGRTAGDNEISAAVIWNQHTNFGQVFEDLPATKHKQALQSFRDAFPDRWDALLLKMMNGVSARLCGECARLLIQEDKLDNLKDALARLISGHNANSELLLWLAKERSDAFADILGPEVFRCMLSAMERDQFNEVRSNRLGDFVLSDSELLLELIASADLDIIRDLTRALLISPAFDDKDRGSLLARIVKNYPSMQALITGGQNRQETGLIVSWSSLERRKQEYDELVHKRIPANSKEIAIARSYGDLRENHEYKAAKEMHRLLMLKKAELESQLVRARGTDFSDAKSDQASIGTRVQVTDPANQHTESFTILGAWDSDPTNGIISYLSPVAQGLLNHRPGEEVEFELEGTRRRYRIDRVEPIDPAQAPAAPVGAASSDADDTHAAAPETRAAQPSLTPTG